MIKAIETKYKGYRFRSRLEARWAVFFDSVGLKWEYEPEGFDIDGTLYLPDFRLERIWLEIKPSLNVPNDELVKVKKFQTSAYGKIDPDTIHILTGSCGIDEYAFDYPYYRWAECPLCRRIEPVYFYKDISGDPGDTDGIDCEWCDLIDRSHQDTEIGYFHKGIVIAINGFYPTMSPRILNAFEAARSARFEFGESGSEKEKTHGR